MSRLRLLGAVFLMLTVAAITPGFAAAAPASTGTEAPYGTFPRCIAGGQAYETQAWWSPMVGAPTIDEMGHDHLGACLPPLFSELTQPFVINAVIQLHNNPSRLVSVRWSDGSSVKQTQKMDYSCATDQCLLVVPLTIDPAKFNRSGYRELRLTADTRTMDNQRMYNTTRWCYRIVSSKPAGHSCAAPDSAKERTGAAGWYSGVGSMNVWTRWQDIQPTIKSGMWPVRVKFDGPTRKKSSTFSGAFATVDPHFHADPVDPGMILPVQQTTGWQRLVIDTTQLTNGLHVLFLQTQAHGTDPLGDGAGIMTLRFTVDNGTLPIGPTP